MELNWAMWSSEVQPDDNGIPPEKAGKMIIL
jgi:hypothetical protein